MNDFVFSKWGYVITATDGGCSVTEVSQNLIPEEMRSASSGISGVEDRDARNRQTMTATLANLALFPLVLIVLFGLLFLFMRRSAGAPVQGENA